MTTALDLLARHEALPSRSGAAAAVLSLVDDPDACAADLAAVIGTDPVFTARVIGLANSSYYGLSGRVGTLSFAVSIVGFQAMRSLAVAAAAGLDGADSTPDGFWQVAATAATACDLIAPIVGANAGDAFSVGLLHTLGAALLHQHQPLPALCLPSPDDLGALTGREVELYGLGHAEAGARVLAAWKFPEHLCSLIARHHDAVPEDADPLQRALAAGRALSGVALDDQGHGERDRAAIAHLTAGRLADDAVDTLVERLLERAQTLLECLTPR